MVPLKKMLFSKMAFNLMSRTSERNQKPLQKTANFMKRNYKKKSIIIIYSAKTKKNHRIQNERHMDAGKRKILT